MSGSAAIRSTQPAYSSASVADSFDAVGLVVVVFIGFLLRRAAHRDRDLGDQRRPSLSGSSARPPHSRSSTGMTSSAKQRIWSSISAALEAAELEPGVEHEVVVAADRP